MKELLTEIDELLAHLEDFTHGQDGEDITRLRHKIAKHQHQQIGDTLNEYTLGAFINNQNQHTELREHLISKIRCQKLDGGILFTKMGTGGGSIEMPYHHCNDFAMAILESYCDFTLKGKINICVNVKHGK